MLSRSKVSPTFKVRAVSFSVIVSGAFFTVTVHLEVLPLCDIALTVTVPALLPVITPPKEVTVAMLVFLLEYLILNEAVSSGNELER